jgi:regulator of sigma E protease
VTERALSELRDGLGRDAYWRQRTWKRIAVIFAGPGMNLVLALLLPMIAYLMGAPGDTNTFVKRVSPHTPAARIGLRAGDEIIAVGGQPTPTFPTVSARIRGSEGKPITVTVLRGMKPVTLGPTRAKKSDGGTYVLGFNPDWDTIKLEPGAAFRRSADDNWQAAKATATFLPRLLTKSGREKVSGPIGITDVSRQAVQLNFALFLEILGLISLSLALLNLLPLLPLDGGHILFSVIEGVRGRAVGREIYERVSALGIALFMILMFIGLSNDISRLGG